MEEKTTRGSTWVSSAPHQTPTDKMVEAFQTLQAVYNICGTEVTYLLFISFYCLVENIMYIAGSLNKTRIIRVTWTLMSKQFVVIAHSSVARYSVCVSNSRLLESCWIIRQRCHYVHCPNSGSNSSPSKQSIETIVSLEENPVVRNESFNST